MSENYTYEQVQDMLGISQATLYKRLEKFKNVIEKHVTVIERKKHLDSTALDIVKNNSIEKIENIESNRTAQLEKENELLKKDIVYFKEKLEDKIRDIEKLENEISNKNKQIENLDKRHNEANILARNTQELFASINKKLLLLENNNTNSSSNKKSFFSFLNRN